MIKVLAIVGSPRKGKNNDSLVQYMLKGIEDNSLFSVSTDKLYANTLNIGACKACDSCGRIRGCILKDDMIDIYEKFNNADLVILSSPLYFNSISGQLKIIIDRNQAIWSSKYILNNSLINKEKKRLGYFICTAGMPDEPKLFDATLPIMELFFKSINTSHEGNLLISNVDKHPIMDDNEVLGKSYNIGKKLILEFQKELK